MTNNKGNINIANFLGINTLEREELIVKGIYTTVEDIPFLQFDKSFDWLMVAIYYLQDLDYSFNIEQGSCTVTKETNLTPIVWNTSEEDGTINGLKDVLFQSILDVIADYHKNNPVNTIQNLYDDWGTKIYEEDSE